MEKNTKLSQSKKKVLEQLLKGNKTIKKDEIIKQDRKSTNPLSFAQKRIWFLEQLVPNTATYNIPAVIRLEGNLHFEALEYSMEKILRRHEILRTNFILNPDGNPVQAIKEVNEIKLENISLIGLPRVEQEKELNHIINNEIRKPFQLESDLLVRAKLITLDENSYRLVIVMHHIVADGWSFGVLAKDIMYFYKSYYLDEGLSSEKDKLDIQYADYAEWQKKKLEQGGYQNQLYYWLEILSGELPMLQLPTTKGKKGSSSYEGARFTFDIDKKLAADIKALAKDKGCTLYMVLLAAYNLLLYRYSDQEDLIVGTPVANRSRKDIEQLIGFFVNTLAIRVNLTGNPTIEELLTRVKRATVGAFSNQDLPFEILVEKLQPDREGNQTPIFQTMFILQNSPSEKIQLPDISLDFLEVDNGTAKFDILLSTMETEQGLLAAFEYKTNQFESGMVRNMAKHFEKILKSFVKNSKQHIHEVEMLTDKELKFNTIKEFNYADAKSESMTTVFEKTVDKYPNHIAISYKGETITYAELNKQTNQFTRYLKENGVKQGDFVGLSIERSIHLIIGMISILKCGAAYLPLDPNYPSDRLKLMISDSGVQTIITTTKSPEINIEYLNCIQMDKVWSSVDEHRSANIEEKVDASELAYILYTSGSTGKPKGVLVEHANVVRLFTNTEKMYSFSGEDVWTLFHSYAFDFSVWEIWGALLYGGKLVVVPYETSRDPDEFLDLLLREKVTILNQTPSAFKQLLQARSIYEKRTKKLLQLRYVIFGGEALEPQILSPWFNNFGGQRPFMINMYGITETTVHVTYRQIKKQDILQNKGSIIGEPIEDLYVYILDKQYQPVPTGVPGELYVGGGGVARGYWNRDEITNERFIPDPFLEDQPKIYRTGDHVKRTFTGELEYVGRIDNQVKVRGFRIELGEIESLIMKKSGIKGSIVTVYNNNQDKQIVSYLVLDETYRKSVVEKLELNNQQVNEWEEVFDDYYIQDNQENDPTFNINGWNSTYTNKPIPSQEMKTWVESTVEKILCLNPKKVLEIGIGTGMILYNVAPYVENYIGTDLSKQAIDYTRQQINALGIDNNQIQVMQQAAHQLDQVKDNSVDTVILNSIIQYFPSEDYLMKVIDQAIQKLTANGKIFIGDVRDYELLKLYNISVALYQSEEDCTIKEFKSNVNSRALQENELLISSAYFSMVRRKYPQITNIEFTQKRGQADNEMSKFRYDVVIYIGKTGEKEEYTNSNCTINWDIEQPDIGRLKEMLIENQPDHEAIFVENILNKRLEKELRVFQLMDKMDKQESIKDVQEQSNQTQGIHPEALWKLASDLGFKLHVTMNDANKLGFYHALFYKDDQALQLVSNKIMAFFNEGLEEQMTTFPLQERMGRVIASEMRSYLEGKLPSYMIPNDFILVDNIPLTSNGKADVEALPKPMNKEYSGTSNNGYQSPQTITEKELANIWGESLGIKKVGTNENFFDIGGHSLLATQLLFNVREAFDVNLALRELFEKPTITEMASLIDEILKGNSIEIKDAFDKDLRGEVYLDEEIIPIAPYQPRLETNILLTGVTGFFGAFVLNDYLNETDCNIYCLIRATDNESAKKRIMDNLAKYELLDEGLFHRIIPVVGDLSQPYLGLSLESFHNLADRIDSVIHNGAHVNFVYPYDTLKNVNVSGTKEMIRFACTKKVKPVHFVSTLYVYPPSNEEEMHINEGDPLTSSKGLRMGYTQTKWVAENILDIAKDRGVPVNIYRLGRISGHSKTGACQTQDFFWSIIKGCIETGQYPDGSIYFELSPVDHLSRSLVQIIRGQTLNSKFHLFNKHLVDLEMITKAISALNFSLEKVPFDEWIEKLSKSENAARPLVNLIGDGVFQGSKMTFDNQNVEKEIEGFNKVYITEDMIQATMKYFMKIGYLPIPAIEGEVGYE